MKKQTAIIDRLLLEKHNKNNTFKQLMNSIIPSSSPEGRDSHKSEDDIERREMPLILRSDEEDENSAVSESGRQHPNNNEKGIPHEIPLTSECKSLPGQCAMELHSFHPKLLKRSSRPSCCVADNKSSGRRGNDLIEHFFECVESVACQEDFPSGSGRIGRKEHFDAATRTIERENSLIEMSEADLEKIYPIREYLNKRRKSSRRKKSKAHKKRSGGDEDVFNYYEPRPAKSEKSKLKERDGRESSSSRESVAQDLLEKLRKNCRESTVESKIADDVSKAKHDEKDSEEKLKSTEGTNSIQDDNQETVGNKVDISEDSHNKQCHSPTTAVDPRTAKQEMKNAEVHHGTETEIENPTNKPESRNDENDFSPVQDEPRDETILHQKICDDLSPSEQKSCIDVLFRVEEMSMHCQSDASLGLRTFQAIDQYVAMLERESSFNCGSQRGGSVISTPNDSVLEGSVDLIDLDSLGCQEDVSEDHDNISDVKVITVDTALEEQEDTTEFYNEDQNGEGVHDDIQESVLVPKGNVDGMNASTSNESAVQRLIDFDEKPSIPDSATKDEGDHSWKEHNESSLGGVHGTARSRKIDAESDAVTEDVSQTHKESRSFSRLPMEAVVGNDSAKVAEEVFRVGLDTETEGEEVLQSESGESTPAQTSRLIQCHEQVQGRHRAAEVDSKSNVSSTSGNEVFGSLVVDALKKLEFPSSNFNVSDMLAIDGKDSLTYTEATDGVSEQADTILHTNIEDEIVERVSSQDEDDDSLVQDIFIAVDDSSCDSDEGIVARHNEHQIWPDHQELSLSASSVSTEDDSVEDRRVSLESTMKTRAKSGSSSRSQPLAENVLVLIFDVFVAFFWAIIVSLLKALCRLKGQSKLYGPKSSKM